MRFLWVVAVVLLLVFPFAHSLEPAVEESINKYTIPSERVTYVELVSGSVTTNILIKVDDQPVMVLDRFGRPVTTEQDIRQVVGEYVASTRPPYTVEQGVARVVAETAARVERAAIRSSANYSSALLNESAAKIENSKRLLTELSDFAAASAMRANLAQQVEAIRKSDSLAQAQVLNESFNANYSHYKAFADSVERNAIRIANVLNVSKRSRELLGAKVVSAGRNNPQVVEAQGELARVQQDIQAIQARLNNAQPIDDTFTADLYSRSNALLAKIEAIEGGASRGAYDWIPAAAIVLMLVIVLALYFKRLKDKQREEERKEAQGMEQELEGTVKETEETNMEK